MKSYLSKLSVLLFGAMFAVAACQDYDEDIRQVNTDLSAKIDAAVADLEQKMATAEDLKNLQDELAKVQESIEKAVADLTDAYKAGDAVLQDKINAAMAEATKAIADIDAAYKAADETLKTDLELVEGHVAALQATLAEVSAKADKTAEDLAALAVELRAADVAINTLIAELTERVAANESAIADLQKALADEKTAREALEKKHELDKNELLGKIEANKAAIEAEVEAREALSKEFAAYKAENDKKIAALEAADEELQKAIDDAEAEIEALEAALNAAIAALNAKLEGLAINVDTLIARVQSLVYVPDYTDGKATLRYAIVVADQEHAYIPGKSVLRYKVNSTEEGVVEDLVVAFAADNSILAYDLEGVKVRANEGEATLEIVGVSADKDGYLVVEVLAKNFLPQFYLGTTGYSAALVLAQAEKKNDVASEFTNLVPTTEPDFLDLAVKYTKEENELVLKHGDVDLKGKTPYVNEQLIPSAETDKKVYTTPSQAYVLLAGDETYYSTDALYEKYGYFVEIKKSAYVTSYLKTGKLDLPETVDHLCWEESINKWNEDKFIVVNSDQIGTQREVSLTSYDEANKAKYDERVYSYLEVVDSYFLAGQKVAVADKVEISKNLVYIDFETVTVDWTLQRALDLRADDGTPYANTIVLENVKYNNIYDLNPIFTPGNIQKTTRTLNGETNWTPFGLANIVAPKTGEAGTATVNISKGYEFAAANADKDNAYKVVWQTVLSETTDAIITLNVVFGKYPETVVVESEVELDLIVEGNLANNFKGADALIADAYVALTPEKAGFAETAAVNDILYTALTDEANTVVNDPNSAYNLNFAVTENVDNSFVLLYHAQVRNVRTVSEETYEFKRDIETWFGVPFKFIVTAKPQLPEVELVRSTEYAHATNEVYADSLTGEDLPVYSVDLQAYIKDEVYTVVQSDLAYYLNVVGEAHVSQKVSFAVEQNYVGNVSIVDKTVTAVQPLETPVNNPLVGLVSAYLQKENTIINWIDGTVALVKATLWAGAYPLDDVIIKLNVEDPLKFEVADVPAKRNVGGDTDVKVYKNFSLTSTVAEHADVANLFDVDADSIQDILAAKYVKAYGIDLKVEKITVYEEVTLEDGTKGQVLYDNSKYTWNETTGVITLHKDDANELINPIVATFQVTFSHNVHPGTKGNAVVKYVSVRFDN